MLTDCLFPIPLQLAQISGFYYNSSYPPLTHPKEDKCQIP